MTDERVRDAYTRRAEEYVEALGSVGQMHVLDLSRIREWAARVDGEILDAGCGPGHWTAMLHASGHTVRGIDLVTAFVDQARLRFPGIAFEAGSLRALPEPDQSFGGVLAWFSLIHEPHRTLPGVLGELHRVIVPSGRLLIGFFLGPSGATFDHAVTTGYFASIEEMTAILDACGFTVEDVTRRFEDGSRPQGSISAVVR